METKKRKGNVILDGEIASGDLANAYNFSYVKMLAVQKMDSFPAPVRLFATSRIYLKSETDKFFDGLSNKDIAVVDGAVLPRFEDMLDDSWLIGGHLTGAREFYKLLDGVNERA